VLAYRTDTPEFELTRLEWLDSAPSDVPLRHAGAQVLICTDGALSLTSPAGETLHVRRGDSAWLPAEDCVDGPVLARPAGAGHVQVFRATAGAV
jgi:mannose-6-phosphate isomerase